MVFLLGRYQPDQLNNLSNALIESTNTKLRVLHRMAFGFKEPEHLIALALLDRGGYCPLVLSEYPITALSWDFSERS